MVPNLFDTSGEEFHNRNGINGIVARAFAFLGVSVGRTDDRRGRSAGKSGLLLFPTSETQAVFTSTGEAHVRTATPVTVMQTHTLSYDNNNHPELRASSCYCAAVLSL